MAKQKAKKTKAAGWQPKQKLVSVMVDNPYHNKDHYQPKTDGDENSDASNPVKVSAKFNLKESPIGLLAHRRIINEAQVRAAAEFRKLWETMGGAGVRAMDYSIDAVDGGGIADPISHHQMDAAKKLRDLRKHVGIRPYDILVKIVGQGIEITTLGKTQRERLTISDYLKDGLEDSAKFWGFETRQSPVNNKKTAY